MEAAKHTRKSVSGRKVVPLATIAVAGIIGTLGALAAPTTGAAAISTSAPPAHCQVTWDEPHTSIPGVWGRFARLNDSAWLAVSTRFSRSNSILEVRTGNSPTNGLFSWSAKPIAEIVEPGRFLDNGHLLRLTNGTMLLTGRSVVDGASYHLPFYRSLDGGFTWTHCSDIDQSDGPKGTMRGRGLWEPYLYLLADGRVAAAYANEKHSAESPSYSQVCSVRVATSTNDVHAWGPESIIVAEPGGGGLRPGMPVVQRMADGQFIAVYEIVGKGDADVFCKVSDDGIHWEPGLGRPIPGHHAGPWVSSLTDGRLLLTSCANTLSCSLDYGGTWRPVQPRPFDVPPGKVFTWPAIYEVRASGGSILCTISRRGIKTRLGNLE